MWITQTVNPMTHCKPLWRLFLSSPPGLNAGVIHRKGGTEYLFLFLSFETSLYILDITIFGRLYDMQKFFSGPWFVILFSLECLSQKTFLKFLVKSELKLFLSHILVMYLKGHKNFVLYFLLSVLSFIFYFKSIIQFELSFVNDIRYRSRFFFFWHMNM